jgi:hypothetical protein
MFREPIQHGFSASLIFWSNTAQHLGPLSGRRFFELLTNFGWQWLRVGLKQLEKDIAHDVFVVVFAQAFQYSEFAQPMARDYNSGCV